MKTKIFSAIPTTAFVIPVSSISAERRQTRRIRSGKRSEKKEKEKEKGKEKMRERKREVEQKDKEKDKEKKEKGPTAPMMSMTFLVISMKAEILCVFGPTCSFSGSR